MNVLNGKVDIHEHITVKLYLKNSSCSLLLQKSRVCTYKKQKNSPHLFSIGPLKVGSYLVGSPASKITVIIFI